MSALAGRARFIVVFACAALSARAFADPKQEAAQHVQASAKLFQDGKFNEALGELTAAYDLDPQPGLLYSIGQIHVKLGDCTQAIESYRKFLDTKPDPKPTEAAREAIAACEQKLQAEGKPLPETSPATITQTERAPPPPPTPPPPPPAVAPTKPAWYADPVLDTLAFGGVAGAVIGVIYYSKMSSDYNSAEHAASYATHHSLVESGHTAQAICAVASASGGALIVGAVLRYIVFDRPDEPSTVGIVPTRDGAAVTWSGRF